MKIKLGDSLTLHYRLSCQGTDIVNTFGEGPETFTLGHNDIDPRLESLLLGLAAGDHRVFDLEAGDAFGARDPELIQTLPRSDFPAAMELAVNGGVQFELPNGQTLTGTVLALDADHVQVDFNHPLAGLAVEFEVQILASQPAGVST